MVNVCVRMCESMYHLPTRVLCIIIVIIQGGILDYYLVVHKNMYWLGWIAADVAVLLTFIMAFVISYRHLRLVLDSSSNTTHVEAGSLPMGYIAWLIYSLALAIRVGFMFTDFTWNLDEADVFGPNTLKITISAAAAVFLLLLTSHHDAESNSDRKHYIAEITATVVFDILDSVDSLDILFDKEDVDDLPQGMGLAIVCISCMNLIIPVLPLTTLSHTNFGHKPRSETIVMLHKLSLVFLVNLPLLIFRMLLWHSLSKEISIFPVKNVIVITLVFHDLYEKQREKTRRQQESDDYYDGNEMREVQSPAKAFLDPPPTPR